MRNVQQGDSVAKDMVLARLRGDDYVAKVNQAKSQLTQAQASFQKAKLDFNRATNLFEAQSLTKSDYDEAKARFEETQAGVTGARAQLSEAETALRDCALKAPMDGVLIQRNIEVGTLVGPGTVGFVLADVSWVKAVFGVPDLMLKNLKLGSSIAITTESFPGVDFHGQITAISPAADPKSRVFDIEITIPNPRNQLKPGMIASLMVPGEEPSKPVAVVSLAAIVGPKDASTGYSIYVVEEQNGKQIAYLRRVMLGEVYGNLIAVTEGVKIGERVIVTGATLVTDGEEVRVIP
jgi:multidrug efflux system membrane fusion protein